MTEIFTLIAITLLTHHAGSNRAAPIVPIANLTRAECVALLNRVRADFATCGGDQGTVLFKGSKSRRRVL